jgi:CO/xanthine dehydrogenase Mo-binding subunit
MTKLLTRRAFLTATGALAVTFRLGLLAQAQEAAPTGSKLPGSLKVQPHLVGWIEIAPDGKVTVLTGKAELGQGIKTALIQVAAEELDLDPHTVAIIAADTGLTADEGYTAGSHSMQDSGTAIQQAAREVRSILVAAAATQLGVPPEDLVTDNGRIKAKDGRSLGYGDLVASLTPDLVASGAAPLKDPKTFTVIGKPFARVDIPAKVTGGAAYVQDLRLPGMLHARVVRPPRYGAKLAHLDETPILALPGVVKIVRDGSYLGVLAKGEWQAIVAMRALYAATEWTGGETLPDRATIFATIKALPARDTVILNRKSPPATVSQTIKARYLRPYGMHGSIGPSCAVAHLDNGTMTVWTHTQGVFPDRAALAELLQMPPDKVRCIHAEGSGCYGHNGADDAAADAALLARAVPGTPVRVQWMREQENTWEPFTPAMITDVQASLDPDGRIVDWTYDVWSNTHNMRPGNAGRLMPSWALATPLTPSPPMPIPMPEGGGDRNAIPLYDLPQAHVVSHFIPDMPLRVSAMRGLGAYTNVFSIESFMDELAIAAEQDPVAFRLAHLSDPRARDVVALAAHQFGWDEAETLPHGHGRGFAFARYKNLGAYCAIALEIAVDHESGRLRMVRANCAVDSGLAVSPDGIRNQISGGVVQSSSWTIYEEVGFEPTGVTSIDWSSYPILRFPAVADTIDVHIIDRPGMPFLGTGEAAQGPTAAAIANALYDATKIRMRELPLSAPRVKAAIGV